MPCTICLKSFTFTTVVELDCGHVLHYKCLLNLLKSRTRKCPLCRAKIQWYIGLCGFLRKKYT